MMRKNKLILPLILGFVMVACRLLNPVPETPGSTPTQILPDTPTPPPELTETPAPVDSPTPESSPTPVEMTTPVATQTVAAATPTVERPEEAILILEPGPGSRVTSPVRVAGVADPTFEQNLVVRLVLDDGTELAQAPTTIQADVGQRGEFEIEMPVDVDMERNIFIQVYATSPRDGGITHLSSTGVIFSPAGPEEIIEREPHPEQIAIFQPQTGVTVSGGVAHVEGFALASFEQALLVEIQDADGNVVGVEPITVQAPDLGQPGPFSADVSFTVSGPGPGRVVVRDISPAFGGDAHLNSVEVNLEP